MIEHVCPRCKATLSSPDSLAGQAETCHACENVTLVPHVGIVLQSPSAGDLPRPRLQGNCPACGSFDTMRAATAWEMGTYRTKMTTLAGAMVGDSVVPVMASGQGENQSYLAERMAPPRPMTIGTLYYVILTCVIMATGALLAAICYDGRQKIAALAFLVAIPIGLGLLKWRWNQRAQACRRHNECVYGPALEAWKLLWVCRRCGASFGEGQA